jgi:hypothetical protein
MESWRILLMFLIRLVLAAGLLWAVFRYMGAIPTLLAIPAAGVLLAKPIIEAGGNWFAWAKRQPYEKWNGNYYEFAGTQIRIYPVGDSLWFADADVLKVIGQKPTLMLESTFDPHEYDLIPGTRQHGFSEEGVEKLLRASDHYEAMRMLIWIHREVVKPFRRKQENARLNRGA